MTPRDRNNYTDVALKCLMSMGEPFPKKLRSYTASDEAHKRKEKAKRRKRNKRRK